MESRKRQHSLQEVRLDFEDQAKIRKGENHEKNIMCRFAVFATLLAGLTFGGAGIANAAGVSIDTDNFPDSDFRNHLLCIDDGDGTLIEEEIEGLISIESGTGAELDYYIEDFTAIHHLSNLKILVAQDAKILDVSQNLNLKRFILYGRRTN